MIQPTAERMMHKRISLTAVVLAFIASGCDESSPDSVSHAIDLPLHEQRVVSFQREPNVAYFDDVVFVDDKMLVVESTTASVSAFNVSDGRRAWTVGRKGAGPGEYLEPRFFVARPDATVGVIDVRQGRITVLNPSDGSVKEVVSGERVTGDLNNVCGRIDGSFLAIKMPQFDVVRIDERPESTPLFRIQWPVETYNQSPMLQQGLFARSRDGRCVVFQPRGDFFYEVDGDSLPRNKFHRYAIAYPPQQIDRSQRTPRAIPGGGAAQYAALKGDTLFVLRGGPSKNDLGKVDLYLLASGARIGTLLLPSETYIFDVKGSSIVTLVNTDEGSVLTLYQR
ncbi:MAG: 6-bladed beta-propeller [Gemmatimonadaceae bacterium]|nr:6-bladed beta-propeller [Gemmatimonadaceae bacterium]